MRRQGGRSREGGKVLLTIEKSRFRRRRCWDPDLRREQGDRGKREERAGNLELLAEMVGGGRRKGRKPTNKREVQHDQRDSRAACFDPLSSGHPFSSSSFFA